MILRLHAPRAWTLWTAGLEAVAVVALLYPFGFRAAMGGLLVLGLAYGDMWLRHREEFAAGLLRARPLDSMSALHALLPFLLSLVLAMGANTFGLPFPSLSLFMILWSLCAAIVLADVLFILPPAIARFLWQTTRTRDGEVQTGSGS